MKGKFKADKNTDKFIKRFKGKCELIPSNGLNSIVNNKNSQGIDTSAALISLKLEESKNNYDKSKLPFIYSYYKSQQKQGSSEDKYHRKFYPITN